MERLSRKMNFPKAPPTPEVIDKVVPNVSRWLPLLCAGAAAGVSLIALKEIKSVRQELIVLKRENGGTGELNKRMQSMEEQLKILSDFIKKGNGKSEVIKKAVKEENPSVQIINNEEYEEVEVTDDESDESS
jgi:hypothetical protein